MSSFALADGIDIDRLAERFARDGRVQVKPVLAHEAARRVQACLANEVTWSLVFNDGDKHYDLHPEQTDAMPATQRQQLMGHVLTRARDHFQYLYHSYPIADKIAHKTNAYPLLEQLFTFLNSARYLDFIRALTGFADIAYCDAQATFYGPGHFLTAHDDNVAGKNRRAAYVLNLTSYWRPDWGGNLLFLDKASEIVGGYVPAFNALNIFAVPQRHAVSYLPPYAGSRYAVTGWLRAR
ncbi:MAG: 2OG-Fe(II) oxygenase [Pseudomonadota bacterium]|jgi:SM-20-related protein